jgi:hypothetical protein
MSAIPLSEIARPPLQRVTLAQHPIDSGDVFLYHKISRRAIYEQARAEQPACDDVILWNERGEITESCSANVVIPLVYRPNVAGDPNSGPKTIAAYFNVAAFARPPANSFGNAGRNIIRGPGFKNVDFALSRTFRLSEKLGVQFRGEFFNALKHPNFGFPNATADTTSFGKVTTALDPRQVQIAARVTF